MKFLPFSLATFLLVASYLVPLRAGDGPQIIWKPEPYAMLKLDGRPVKTWNLYHAEKKKQLYLVQLGYRFLILDIKEQSVHEIPPASVKPHGKDVATSKSSERRAIPSAEWAARDVGPAEMIRVRLLDYGKILELQIPHPLNPRVAY